MPAEDTVCMITGANSGIGKVAALEIAKTGITVIMVCRDPVKGKRVQEEILATTGNTNVDLMIADLSSFSSIRELVAQFKQKYTKLHILINNAGIYLHKRLLSVDNIEKTMATNHFGPFLLTNLLMDILKTSAPARIINVSSVAHIRGKINFTEILNPKKYHGLSVYSNSKLASILFTHELAHKLKGTTVTVNCLHPGFVRTNFGASNKFFTFFSKMLHFISLSPTKGAETTIFLALSPEVSEVTGQYFNKKKVVSSSKRSYDTILQQQLWDFSEKTTHLNDR